MEILLSSYRDERVRAGDIGCREGDVGGARRSDDDALAAGRARLRLGSDSVNGARGGDDDALAAGRVRAVTAVISAVDGSG